MVIEPTYSNIINITSYLFFSFVCMYFIYILHLENSSFGGRGSWWKKNQNSLVTRWRQKKKIVSTKWQMCNSIIDKLLVKANVSLLPEAMLLLLFFLTCPVRNHELNRHIAKTPKFRHVDFKTMQMKKKLIFTSEL